MRMTLRGRATRGVASFGTEMFDHLEYMHVSVHAVFSISSMTQHKINVDSVLFTRGWNTAL